MINYHELSNYHVTPSLSNANDTFGMPFEQKLTLLNRLSIPISVATRNGLKFTAKSEPCLFNPGFTVKLEITLGECVRDDVISALANNVFKEDNVLGLIKTKISQDLEYNQWNRTTRVTIDFSISLSELETLGGSCYLHDVDLVISKKHYTECPNHPHSEAGIGERVIENTVVPGSFSYVVEIIDNLGKYGDRYVYVQNNVYRIVPMKDLHRRDGIYITTKTPVSNLVASESYRTEHYGLSMAPELGLYKTPEEAYSFGDKDLTRKEELLEKEHDLALLKKELQSINLQHEQELATEKHKAVLLEAQLKDEARRAEASANKLKDFYEERSYRRKDESEGWKMMPTIMMGLGAFFMGLKAILGK